MSRVLINRIIPFSSVDGPGNRLVIFLQGCNYNCLYCHNPETINHCNDCGQCIVHCPYKALADSQGKIVWDSTKCQNCDMCIKNCNRNSTPKTRLMRVDEVLNEIIRVKSFITGITVSGGECTLELDFLVSLFKEVRNIGLTTFLDTNGSIPLYITSELLDVTDGIMIDAKSFSDEEHHMLTGHSNEVVLQNIIELGKKEILYEVRTVIVPEILENSENVNKISELISKVNPQIRYKLIKYRDIGTRRELINSYSPDDNMMDSLKSIAVNNGCKNVIIV